MLVLLAALLLAQNTPRHPSPATADLVPVGNGINWVSSTLPLNKVYFGDGSDGNVVISSGTTTLVRNMYYNNLTVNGTGSINAAGYLIFVADTLNLSAAPLNAIQRRGTDSASATGDTLFEKAASI